MQTQQSKELLIPIFFYICMMIPFFILIGCNEEKFSGKPSDSPIVLSKDGAWCWFQDPRAVYIEGLHKRTYAGWMTRDGKLQIGSYDHDSGEIEVFTLKERWDVDDHNSNSFLVLPDRRIMVFYARHNKTGLFCRKTSMPENISQWEDEITVVNTSKVTYSQPLYLSDERRFYVFWRGQSWKPTFSTSTDGEVWTPPKILIQEKGRENNRIRPYFKIASDGKSTIHLTFTDDHPRNNPENSVYYVKYKNGKFCKADGMRVGSLDNLPIQHSQSELVYDGKVNKVRAWVWDIALDEKEHPVIAYTQLPSGKDHRYHYAYWDGQAWFDTEMTSGGRWFPHTPIFKQEREIYYSGGITLNHANPSIVYLSRQMDGTFEIEKWKTGDKGKTWSRQAITSHSTHNNVRPVVPRGYAGKQDHVIWMKGDYVHFTKFCTEIRMLVHRR